MKAFLSIWNRYYSKEYKIHLKKLKFPLKTIWNQFESIWHLTLFSNIVFKLWNYGLLRSGQVLEIISHLNSSQNQNLQLTPYSEQVCLQEETKIHIIHENIALFCFDLGIKENHSNVNYLHIELWLWIIKLLVRRNLKVNHLSKHFNTLEPIFRCEPLSRLA